MPSASNSLNRYEITLFILMFINQRICCIGHIHYSSDVVERPEKLRLAKGFNVTIFSSIKGRSDFTFSLDAFEVWWCAIHLIQERSTITSGPVLGLGVNIFGLRATLSGNWLLCDSLNPQWGSKMDDTLSTCQNKVLLRKNVDFYFILMLDNGKQIELTHISDTNHVCTIFKCPVKFLE